MKGPERSQENLGSELPAAAEEFLNIYEEYLPLVFNYCYKRLGFNEKEAEEQTARIMHKALFSFVDNDIKPRDDDSKPYARWFYTIAHNHLANLFRDENRHPTSSLDEILEKSPASRDRVEGRLRPVFQTLPLDPEAQVLKQERRVALQEAMKRFSTKHPQVQLDVLLLKFDDAELSNEQIGEILGKSVGAIKSLYYRALKNLEKIINSDPILKELLDPES